MNILLGVTGSVAAIKTQELILTLINICKQKNITPSIRVILSNTSTRFIHTPLTEVEQVYSDQADWETEHAWRQKGDPVLHIELRKWADVVVIAPLSAHTLGKIANGLCDTLLTCVCRAWDVKGNKPFIVCPAMNTCMWTHPLTVKQLKVLQEELNVTVVQPEDGKTLACGDVGLGAMRNVTEIARVVIDAVLSVNCET